MAIQGAVALISGAGRLRYRTGHVEEASLSTSRRWPGSAPARSRRPLRRQQGGRGTFQRGLRDQAALAFVSAPPAKCSLR
jgi:hypothetical protein